MTERQRISKAEKMIKNGYMPDAGTIGKASILIGQKEAQGRRVDFGKKLLTVAGIAIASGLITHRLTAKSK